MRSTKKEYLFSLLILLAITIYWVYRIWVLISFELVEGEELYLGNLMLYLLSWFLVFLVINGFAWLNFKYVFLKWKESQIYGFIFWSVELGILAFIFEFLQWLSQQEKEIMKDNFILTMVIALYFLAFTWFFDMIYSKRHQDKLIQQKERVELSLLQSQLNPHFLFNALNTTYSTAIAEDSTQTAQQILQISELMRFALEKSNMDYISLEEEIGFLEKYIQIQSDRFHQFREENFQIRVNWDEINLSISPMLIQPFLENAFKFTPFGLSEGNVKLNLEITVENGQLKLLVENSYFQKEVEENKGTGKGIELVRQRLTSLYPLKHNLAITNKSNIFRVDLRIDLKD